ncbi:MAG: hypothetical protein V3T29_06000 [Alphaproteobacteria bacterium]
MSLHNGLPFMVRIPNAETREAMRQAIAGEDLTGWADLDAIKAARG